MQVMLVWWLLRELYVDDTMLELDWGRKTDAERRVFGAGVLGFTHFFLTVVRVEER